MVRFAPLNVPLKRRRQTVGVLFFVLLILICLGTFLILCTYPSWWPFILIYIGYIYFDVAPEHGGRKIEWVRRWRIWSWFADYFPVTLEAVEPLDPNGRYLFGMWKPTD